MHMCNVYILVRTYMYKYMCTCVCVYIHTICTYTYVNGLIFLCNHDRFLIFGICPKGKKSGK